MKETYRDYHTGSMPEDIPPRAPWNGVAEKGKVVEYRGFKIGIPNCEFPYLWGIDTDQSELSGTYTKLREAQNAIDAYLNGQIIQDKYRYRQEEDNCCHSTERRAQHNIPRQHQLCSTHPQTFGPRS
jgi:hypothetical protein